VESQKKINTGQKEREREIEMDVWGNLRLKYLCQIHANPNEPLMANAKMLTGIL